MENKNYLGFIYLWENLHPKATIHKKYIGQHIGQDSDGYTGSGSIFLRRFYSKKYRGSWVRKVLQYCYTLEELNNAEIEWIKKYNAVLSTEYCNQREGGDSGGRLSSYIKNKISNTKKGCKAWNKGIKGIVKNTPESIQKRIDSNQKHYQPVFENDCQLILNYLKANKYFKATDVPEILNCKCSQAIARHRINILLKLQKIKHVWFGSNDRRYAPADFSFDSILVETIKNTKDCQFKDISSVLGKRLSIDSTMVRTILLKAQKAKLVYQKRGYRKNYYYVRVP